MGWGLLALAIGSIPVLRTWSLQWGTTETELDQDLPGDGVVPAPDHQSTRAITIDAPREDVWKWIIQLGQGRGGFYSYDWLENLAGLSIHSTDEIENDLQHLAEGDNVHLAEGLGLKVAELDPGYTMVLMSPPGAANGPPFRFSWAFVVTDLPGDQTRLVVRERYGYLTRAAAITVEPASMVSFLMSQRMLRGIRERAEGTYGSR